MPRPARRFAGRARRSAKISNRRRIPAFERCEDRALLSSFPSVSAYPVNPDITELPVPTPGGFGIQMTRGADGNVWFTTPNAIETVNLATHALSGFVVPTAVPHLAGITNGPDGKIWFVENAANAIGSFNLTTHVFAEYSIPTGFSYPTGIATGPDGNLWFTESETQAIGMFNPNTHQFSEFPLPPSVYGSPLNIIAGPDGNLWFTQFSAIGSINPTTHSIAEYPVGSSLGQSALTVGPDGKIWFTGTNQIDTIDPVSDAITQFATTSTAGTGLAIAPGPDGNLWFSESGSNAIANFNPTTHKLTEVPLVVNGVTAFASGVVAGADGNVWFTEAGISGNPAYVAEINPTSQVIGGLTLPTSPDPTLIAAGPDHKLWFTEPGANQVGAVDPITHDFVIVTVPTPDASPTGITAGPDGNVWFTEATADKIGVINPATDAVTEFPLTAGAGPDKIIAGADGNLWFTETNGNRIGEINPTTGHVTETNLLTANARPTGIAFDHNGNLWITEPGVRRLAQLDLSANSGTEYIVPGIGPSLITAADGTLWFTMTGPAIGSIDPTTDAINVITLGTDGATEEIVEGPDDNLWFTDELHRTVDRYDPTAGEATAFSSAVMGPSFAGIAAGIDGKIWVADQLGAVGFLTPPVASQTTVLPGPANLVVGQQMTLTATVASAKSGGPPPTGTVTFLDGTKVLAVGTIGLVGGTAQATIIVPALQGGPNSITAEYNGDLTYAPSTSAPMIVDISPDTTTTALASSLSKSKYGVPITFTATVDVSAPGAGTPTGIVIFQEGPTILGTAPVSTTNGVTTAVFQYAGLDVDTHSITAVYGGDDNDLASFSPSEQITITGPADTTTTESPASAVVGQPVVLTATVSDVAPSAGVASGTVSFYEGSHLLGTGRLNAANTGQFTAASMPLGTHQIVAVYGGDKNNNGSSSAAATITIGQDSTQTTLAVPASPAALGTLTLTATVSVLAPGAGSPSGSVTFFDGTQSLGSAPLATANGTTTAHLTTSALAVGSHDLTAVYNGDGNDIGSTSPIASVDVLQATTASVTANANPLVLNQPVTLTATVTPTSPGTIAPTGSVVFNDGSTTLGTGKLSTSANGITTATLAVSPLVLGTHTITVSYAGDPNNLGSTGTLSLPVNLDPTSTSLTPATDSAELGQTVTFIATVGVVSPGTIVPAGTVTLMDGANVLGTETLSTLSGVRSASFATSALGLGTHAITAVYGGSATDAGSASASASVQVNRDQTTTSVALSDSNPVFGQLETCTATVSVVSPGTFLPTGTVTFMDGSSTLGTGTLITQGGVTEATFTTSALSVATHAIVAVYGGDTNDAPSTSASVSLPVVAASTTITIARSLPAPVAGQSEIFTVRVNVNAPGAGTPTGKVDLVVDGTTIGTESLSTVSGVTSTTFTTSSLAVGAHAITAVYEGDGDNQGSTSAPLSLTVGKNGTTITLAPSSRNSVVGQADTFTATVAVTTASAESPTGAVTFLADNQVLGTGSLTTNNGTTTATLTTAALTPGSHMITAVYGGDDNNKPSTSSVQRVTIAQDQTTTAVAADNAVFGQSVTITATVAISSPGSATPTGTVTFSSDGTTLGTGTLSTADGVTTATLTTSVLTVGTHSVVAAYGGDTNDLASSSNAFNLTISQDQTTLTLAPPAGSIAFGEPVAISGAVAVASPGAGLPTGTVTFLEGSTTLGSATLADVGGVATLKWNAPRLSPGTHTITATYSGDTNSASSAASPSTVIIVKASTSTKLSATSNPLIAGQPETLTATVMASNTGAGVPTGTITFKVGTTTIGSAPLVASHGAGVATLKTTVKLLGTQSVTAVYAGTANLAASTSPAVALRVGESFTTTTLSASSTAPVWGQSETFTATVVPSNSKPGAPTGSVTFLDGTTVLGTAVLHTVKGKTTAVFTTRALTAGKHSLVAQYGDTKVDLGSASKPLTVNVAKAQTRATLIASPKTGVAGKSETFTATIAVVSPGSGVPAGTVVFKDGATVLGTATLAPIKGTATATLTTTKLTQGKHAITVVYSGGKNVLGSSSAPLSLTVNKT
jgi:streptogramin lyase